VNHNAELRKQLVALLTERQAHEDVEVVLDGFPEEHLNSKAPGCPYTFWHLLEHLRLCQKDILDYIVSDHYTWPNFPGDYWPEASSITDLAGWNGAVKQFLADRERLVEIIEDPKVDLFAPLPNSGEHQHNVLREIAICASHNSYHIGQILTLRRVMGLWEL
jgi:hypothetical protein